MIAAVLLAACGAADPPPTRPATSDDARRQLHLVAGHDRPVHCVTAPAEGAVVVLRETFFEPACLTVPSGAPIRFRNRGNARHNVTVRAAGASLDLAPGDRGAVRVAPTGSPVEIFCRYHVAAGMTMSIAVE